jgi:hypothetical protein
MFPKASFVAACRPARVPVRHYRVDNPTPDLFRPRYNFAPGQVVTMVGLKPDRGQRYRWCGFGDCEGLEAGYRVAARRAPDQMSSSRPVLSPTRSAATPSRSNSDTNRLVIGVSGRTFR